MCVCVCVCRIFIVFRLVASVSGCVSFYIKLMHYCVVFRGCGVWLGCSWVCVFCYNKDVLFFLFSDCGVWLGVYLSVCLVYLSVYRIWPVYMYFVRYIILLSIYILRLCFFRVVVVCDLDFIWVCVFLI